MAKKNRRAFHKSSSNGGPISGESSSSANTPATIQHALLDTLWRLPRPLRHILLIVVLAGTGLFAFWMSVPEKKREQLIDRVLPSSSSSARPVTSSAQSADVRDRTSGTAGLRPAPTVERGALSVAQMKRLRVQFQTTEGVIEMELLPEVAPNHVRNFIRLVSRGFYDGTRFHRVHPLFMVQGGDPNTRSDDRSSWGRGGSDRTVKAEFNDTPHVRGIVSMARGSDPDSGSSQFFICVERKVELDRNFTAFAKVTKGMEVVDVIAAGARDAQDRPLRPVTIERAVVLAKSP